MTPCIEWSGGRDKDGYGYIKHEGKMKRAHRVAYEAAREPIPTGLVIDHLCRNRACVNPDHLEAVTHQENCRRGMYANKTHCIHGHEFSVENTYFRKVTARRQCRKCNAAAVKRLQERKST